MSMYKDFQTDRNMETSGIYLDYGSFRVKIARAGGANDKYRRVLEAKTKPYRRAIATDTMNEALGQRLFRESFAEAVILDWEVKVTGSDGDIMWQQGIEAPDGSILPFNIPNVVTTFTNLPDLFSDIREQANKVALFRAASLEEEAKN